MCSKTASLESPSCSSGRPHQVLFFPKRTGRSGTLEATLVAAAITLTNGFRRTLQNTSSHGPSLCASSSSCQSPRVLTSSPIVSFTRPGASTPTISQPLQPQWFPTTQFRLSQEREARG